MWCIVWIRVWQKELTALSLSLCSELLLDEGFLVDICLIYAMVSFLAVVVISKVYMGVYAEKYQRYHREEKKENAEGR